MRQQELYRCTIMRGGTSKAVFFKENELPSDSDHMEKVILSAFGSPDVRQIDGLGGSDITTSKVAVIGPSTRKDADIDYLFGQVQLNSAKILWDANCGNISAAVGPYAIDEGMVKAEEPYTDVRIHNVNTGKIIIAKVEVNEGVAAVEGEYKIDGVPGTGSKIELDYRLCYGAASGKLLPTGNPTDVLDVEGIGKIPTSIVDIANSVCFIEADSIGITGYESPPEIRANKELLEKLEKIREAAARKCGFIRPWEKAVAASPIQPLISFVSPKRDYVDYGTGRTIKKADMDFAARILFNQMPTDSFPGTATICISVASQIEGTVVNKLLSKSDRNKGYVNFGHARGINHVSVSVNNTGSIPIVEKAVFNRTARRIMDGYVYIKKSLI